MAFNFLSSLFSSDLSIDLGTANTLIYARGTGLVLDEPSVVAISEDRQDGRKKIVAYGIQAKQMLGRTPENLSTVRPMQDGVIADYKITSMMLTHFIQKALEKTNGVNFFKQRPRILVCVPSGATQVERRAIHDAARSAGASEVFLIPEPMAAAIGAGIPVHEAYGSMVVDIGGGTSEVAVISLNGIVYSNSVRIGGDKFDNAIVDYVRRRFSSIIGLPTAERIKKEIGCAYLSEELKELEVRGINQQEGAPRSFVINSNDVLEALESPLNGIVKAVLTTLENTPPELAADVAERGIVLTGGGALLHDFDKLIMERTRLKVFVAEDPLTCVARGGGRVLELLDQRGVASYLMN